MLCLQRFLLELIFPFLERSIISASTQEAMKWLLWVFSNTLINKNEGVKLMNKQCLVCEE